MNSLILPNREIARSSWRQDGRAGSFSRALVARTRGGREIWRGRFHSQDELDVFVWSLSRGELIRDEFARGLSFPAWHPDLAHLPLIYEFVLNIDSHVTGLWSAGTSFASAALTTANTNDVIVACVSVVGSSLVKVSSLSTTGVVWNPSARKQLTYNTTESLELWFGTASGTISAATTVNLSGTPGSAIVNVFGISGANTSSINDPNGSLPAFTTGTGATPSVSGVSTSNPNVFLIALTAQGSAAVVSQTAGANFTLIDSVTTGAGTTRNSFGSERDIVSAIQSSISVAFGAVYTGSWGIIVDAVQASLIPFGTIVEVQQANHRAASW